ncbi:MAG TPA: Uma2 family endonuclease [Steroidobacteraceae bacterium]|nr:Uma2 family endonuclease [Steroidobacteraceae bacterium]
MNDWIPRHRITVDEYYRMAEVGILPPDARVELIEGEIIDMAPIGSGHGGTIMQLVELLRDAARGRAQVLVQSEIRLSDMSEPQPDFALVKPRTDFYKKKHPGPADTSLIIEVSESSLRYDLQVKAPLYARHGVPEYWVIDLKGRQVRFFRSPDSGQYADVSSTGTPGVVAPVALPEVKIDLTHVLDD